MQEATKMQKLDKTTNTEDVELNSMQLASFVPLASLKGANLIERLQNLKKRETKKAITVRYDADLVEYYKSKGKGYQQAMNNALRVCMEAEKELLP